MEASNQGATTAKEKKGGESCDIAPRPSSASLPFGGAAVVVGGGVAGTAAAAELCSLRPDARVTLVARDDTVKVRLLMESDRAREREVRGRRKRERKREKVLNLGENPGKLRKTKGRHERRAPHKIHRDL